MGNEEGSNASPDATQRVVNQSNEVETDIVRGNKHAEWGI